MSLTTGIIGIKGNHLERLPLIFSAFKLNDTQEDKVLKSWKDVVKVVNEEYSNQSELTFKRVVWFDNDWTIIEDFSFMLCTDNDALSQISKQLSTQVFTMYTQGTGGSYGFSYFDKEKLRGFLCSDGEIMENFGESLAIEKGFNVSENVFYDDIIGLGKQLGIDIEKAENLDRFIVKKLESSEELIKELENFNASAINKTSKPWWKFW
jgi:hypothetical protein